MPCEDFQAVRVQTNIIPIAQAGRKPKISVVMVAFHTGPALLESVKAVLDDPDVFELILVDNGNTPDARNSLSHLIMSEDKVRLMQGHGNVGFATGCNYGARLALGDYLLFLNPDAVLKPSAAMQLADCGKNLTRPWVVGGLLRDINGREQRGGRRGALTPFGAVVTFTGMHKIPGIKSIHLEKYPLPSVPIAVPIVSGAFLMMDRASFDDLGGFDEDYFFHVEDIDLCHRTRKKGGQVYFVPTAAVMHYGSTSRVPRQRIEWEKLKGFIRYFWRYSDKWWGKVLTVLTAPLMLAAIMGRAWYLAFRASLTGR